MLEWLVYGVKRTIIKKKKHNFKLVIARQMYNIKFIVSFTRNCVVYTQSQILQICNILFNIIPTSNLVSFK